MDGKRANDISPSINMVTGISETVWRLLIIASTLAVLLVSVYCLSHNITIIFMHLYYFPIILLAYHYRYRGFVAALFLSFAYVGLVIFFEGGNADAVTGAWYRFLVFVGIALIIAYLSERLVRDRTDILNSSSEYHNLFENMMEGFAYCRMIYDPDGRPKDWVYLKVNPAFETLTGLKNIAGKHVLEAIPTIRELNPELFEIYGRVATTGRPETFEIDFKPLGMWLRVLVFSPEKECFVAVFDDITLRKTAESALKESEKRYRDLFEKNNAVMLLIDPKGGAIVDANVAACRYYGYSREEITALSINMINTAHPDQIRSDMARTVGSSGAVFRFQHRKKDGAVREVRVFSSPIVLGGQQLLHSIIQDITDQTAAEDALKETNKKLNLLSSITRHDIRNQLMALNAYIALSEEVADNPAEIREYTKKEQKIADTIARQIDFTRDYESLGVQSPQWQNISVMIRNASASLPMRNIALDAACPGIELFADPLLEKVFYNLIDNSLRYGGAKMTTIRVTALQGDGNLRLVYEDDGEGISTGDKRELFTKGFGKHTGLGLFISREILAITGITIVETGEPGKCARFEMYVPKGAWRAL